MAAIVSKSIVLVLLGCSVACAALPGLPAGSVPATGTSGMAEVVADTAVASLVVAEGVVAPEFVSVLPDTVNFGGIAHLVLDYPQGTEPTPLSDFTFDAEWVVPAGEASPSSTIDLEVLPQPAGPRVIFPVRVYRLFPFQISGAGGLSKVIHVRGKVADLENAAPVRSPRLWGMDPKQLIIGGLVLLVLFLLVFWFWRKRRTLPPVMVGNTQNPAAWPASAIELQQLHQGGLLERGENRKFLSELARIARGYVAGRYLVSAKEMTGKEIELACLAQGYKTTAVRPFALLIRRVDQSRYNPEPPRPVLCRDEFSELVGLLDTARIVADHTLIPAADLIAGQQAWSELASIIGISEKGVS
jgi:hypothetical protein